MDVGEGGYSGADLLKNLSKNLACAFEEEMCEGDVNHCLWRVGVEFVILAESSEPVEPGKGGRPPA